MSSLALDVASSIADLDPTGIAPKIFNILSKIHEQYGQMQGNKEICQGLKKEIDIVNSIVVQLCETKQMDPCQRTLLELEGCLIQCLTVIARIGVEKDTMGKIKAFLSAKSDQGVISHLTEQLHTIGALLNLALTAQTSNAVEKMMAIMSRQEAEQLPSIQQRRTKINEDVDELQKEIQRITINVAGGQGGVANAKFEAHFHGIPLQGAPHAPYPSRRDSEPLAEGLLRIEQERDRREQDKQIQRDKYILKRLITLFMNRDKGERSKNIDIYNSALEKHNAMLGYNNGQHTLYVNYKPLATSQAAIEYIGTILGSLPDSQATAPSVPSTAAVDKRRPSGIKDFTKKDEKENTLDALKELRRFFLEERDTGEKSANFEAYEQCLKSAHKNAELIYRQRAKEHVLRVDDKELDAKSAAEAIQQMINAFVTPLPLPSPPSPSYSATTVPQFEATKSVLKANATDSKEAKEFLRLVAEGEQDKAEAMLQKNPALALVSEDVTDLSKRTFNNITGFQYAVWALDWHMWTMIRKYLPDDEAKKQAEAFETGSWVRQHGVNAQHLLENLVKALQTTIDLYRKAEDATFFKDTKYAEADTAWVQQVGGAQLILPAHVINEYCHPTRAFYPLPNFKDVVALPRTRTVDAGDWFTAVYGDGKLGEKFAVARCAGPRCVAPVGVVVLFVRCDHDSIRALTATRTAQREELIAKLRKRNVQRFKAA